MLLLALPACAFSDGSPWGRAEVQLEAAFTPADGRLTEDGLLRTNNNYLIRLDSLTMELGTVVVRMTGGEAGDGGGATFDPSAPPPGYSLCHGGHCHADDGRLVAYEDIERELAGGGAAGAGPTVGRPVEGAVALLGEPVDVPLGPCTDDCRLERGELASVGVALTAITFEARVFDLTPTDGDGMPDEGVPIRGTVPLGTTASAALAGAVGEDEPVGVAIAARLQVAESLFDGIDWMSELGITGPVDVAVEAAAFPAVASMIVENVAGGTELVVEVTRF